MSSAIQAILMNVIVLLLLGWFYWRGSSTIAVVIVGILFLPLMNLALMNKGMHKLNAAKGQRKQQ